MFKQNGCNDRQIHYVLYPPSREYTSREEPTLVAFLHFMAPIFNCISRVLMRHNVKTVGLSSRKVICFLQLIKDDLGLENSWHV
jgi:hypothetical protein